MLSRCIELSGSRLRRSRIRLLAGAIAAAQVFLLAPVGAAQAFEIFGFRLFGSAEEEIEAVVDPVNYTVTFDSGESGALDDRLRRASTLLADEERPVSGSLGILAKARNERELLVATLYEEARYEGVVEIRIEGRALDSLPPDAVFDTSRPVPITVTVRPGPEFTLGDVAVRGNAPGIDPAEYGLVRGGDASSDAVLGAENRMVRALEEQGRPLARALERDIIADHPSRTLDVAMTLEAGPVAPYGRTDVSGTQSVDPDFTAYMAGLEAGRTYSPEEVEEARERLVALEVFDSVTVRKAEALDENGAIPIDVEVSERKHRYFGVGATISSNEGAGFEGYWGHRNLFGRAERLRFEGSISRIGATSDPGKFNFNSAILFEKPGVIGPASKFIANLRGVYEHPDAYDRFAVGGGAGVSYELTKHQTVSIEGRLEYSRIEDAFGEQEYLIPSIPMQYVYDNRDDPLNPTEGFRALAYVEPSYDIYSGSTWVKTRTEGSAYLAADDNDRFVLAGRLALGSIFGAGLTDIPADRRFYSGGGGSVRGYAFQGIGPRDPVTNRPTGGRSFAEASLEVRVAINDTYSVVPFIDAGTVSEAQFPDFNDIRFGAGVGLRYATPFGPLRIDVAIPLDRRPGDPSFGLYAGIGQAF
jgi:translocation and assembly module TamA